MSATASRLFIERTFDASRSEVFEAWTDPNQIVKWWGPQGMTVPEFEFDVRPGGAWTTTMMNAEGQRFTVSGVYKTIDAPALLVMTWAWRQDDGSRGHETEVKIALEEHGDKTVMKFEQAIFQDDQARDNHQQGWTSAFEDLRRYVEG